MFERFKKKKSSITLLKVLVMFDILTKNLLLADIEKVDDN